jgi:IclR family acetate operon transcriptional repressor
MRLRRGACLPSSHFNMKTRPIALKRVAKSRVAAELLPADAYPDGAEQNTGSLQRGLKILDAIVSAERRITLAEIADLVKLNSSTTHRLLQTLIQLGYVERDSLKRYYPSAAALFPANLFHPLNILRRGVSEELQGLRKQFGLAASFIMFMGRQRCVLETIHGNAFLSPYNSTIVTHPLHATVSGKILLATLSEGARTELLGQGPYQAHTPRTIVTHQALKQELAGVAERGYATAIDELLLGLSAVGAPVWSAPSKALGAIVVAGPTQHFDATNMAAFAKGVSTSAALFSQASPTVRATCHFFGH